VHIYQSVHDIYHIHKSKIIQEWKKLANRVDSPVNECTVAMVGKYCNQGDAYLSVIKALTHSAIATRQKLNIEFIDSSDLELKDGAGIELLP
jgi:CTP synthase